MPQRIIALSGALLLAGCSGGSTTQAPSPAPTPTPSPTPAPSPAPSPTPTPTPTASPSPTPAATYTRFDDLFADRSFQSACSGFILPGQPPAVLPVTNFGQGLFFNFISTPQVFAIGGDGVSISFNGQDIDASAPVGVLAYVRTIGGDTDRFSISRPAPGGIGLDYARFASVATPRAGTTRLYQCVIGVPTLTTDLPTTASGVYPRSVIGATAYVRDTASARPYSTGRSTITVAADFVARRVTVTGALVGTPLGVAGPDIPLGSFTATGDINPITGNFTAPLTSSDRTVTGSISGRFFGPQGSEVGIAFSATGPETAQQFAFSIAGTVYAAR